MILLIGCCNIDLSPLLQCWSLGQATYVLGGNQGVPSYVVGYGPNPPTIVQQMASSCEPQPPISPAVNISTDANASYIAGAQQSPRCNWFSGFFPGVPNPRLDLIQGALVWGPGEGSDHYRGSSRRYDDTRVRLEDNVGFTGLLAGLTAEAVDINSCFLGHGVWQRYIQTGGGI